MDSIFSGGILLAIAIVACGGPGPTPDPSGPDARINGSWRGSEHVSRDGVEWFAYFNSVHAERTASTVTISGLCIQDSPYDTLPDYGNISVSGNGAALSWAGEMACPQMAECENGALRFTSGKVTMSDDGTLTIHLSGNYGGCGKTVPAELTFTGSAK